jgi:hypothetical protein
MTIMLARIFNNFRGSLEDIKSKLIVERHEREQETNNNKIMLKVNSCIV